MQYSDFFSSILAFWVTLVAMAEIPIRYVSLCHMFGVLIIAFGVESNKTSLSSVLIPLGMGILFPVSKLGCQFMAVLFLFLCLFRWDHMRINVFN